jgi:two-component system cell cycle response regulator
VLVEDVMTSPLYADVRQRWVRDGTMVTTRSVIALPFALDQTQAGVFFLRRALNEPKLTPEDIEFADTVVKAAVAAVQRAKVLETTMADNRRLEVLAQTDPLTASLTGVPPSGSRRNWSASAPRLHGLDPAHRHRPLQARQRQLRPPDR